MAVPALTQVKIEGPVSPTQEPLPVTFATGGGGLTDAELRAAPVVVTNTPGLPSAGTGRVRRFGNTPLVNVTTTAYTVPVGKTFNMLGYSISARNSHITIVGDFGIGDDGGMEVRFMLPVAIATQVNPHLYDSVSSAEPIVRFGSGSAVQFLIAAGSIEGTLTVWGYEE